MQPLWNAIKSFLAKLTFHTYVLLTIAAILIGFRVKPLELITAESGLGYWLGIIGGVGFLFLLVYPLRKRMKFLRASGSVRSWFRLHMIVGVAAPVIILYHSNFSLGSFNSTVALFTMLIVAVSGLIGRYVYAKVHAGLYGNKVELAELQKSIEDRYQALSGGDENTSDSKHWQMREIASEISEIANSEAFRLSEGLKQRKEISKLTKQLRSECKLVAKENRRWLRDTSSPFDKEINQQFRALAKEADKCGDLFLYQRLFALWHYAHLPLFFMLVIAAIIHVFAVHAY